MTAAPLCFINEPQQGEHTMSWSRSYESLGINYVEKKSLKSPRVIAAFQSYSSHGSNVPLLAVRVTSTTPKGTEGGEVCCPP